MLAGFSCIECVSLKSIEVESRNRDDDDDYDDQDASIQRSVVEVASDEETVHLPYVRSSL